MVLFAVFLYLFKYDQTGKISPHQLGAVTRWHHWQLGKNQTESYESYDVSVYVWKWLFVVVVVVVVIIIIIIIVVVDDDDVNSHLLNAYCKLFAYMKAKLALSIDCVLCLCWCGA